MPAKNSNNYYLYSHTRIDKNEVFYIGIGTKNYKSKSYEYARAYNKTSRNRYWKDIIKNTEYIVDIINESDNYDFIKDKEKELIKYYGFIKNGGTLCNLTTGGQGFIKDISSVILFKNSMKNKKWKQILQYDINGKFIKKYNGAGDIINNGFHFANVLKVIKGKVNKAHNSIWFYEESFNEDLLNLKLKELSYKKVNINARSIKMLNTDNIELNTFNSISEASQLCNISRTAIKNCLCKYSKTAGGYKWSYNNLK